jgi:23S rRNA-/tRNA-specific pseudouridylate synthase
MNRIARRMMDVSAPPHVVYRDVDFLLVRKPPGTCMDGAGSEGAPAPGSTMEGLLAAHHALPFGGRWRHCHQLDYGTSGLLLYAAHRDAAAAASSSFEHRKARKTYLALVEGHVDAAAALQRPGVRPFASQASSAGPCAQDLYHQGTGAGLAPPKNPGGLYARLAQRVEAKGGAVAAFVTAHPWHLLKARASEGRKGTGVAEGAHLLPSIDRRGEEVGSSSSSGGAGEEAVVQALEARVAALFTPEAAACPTSLALRVFEACAEAAVQEGARYRRERDAAALGRAAGGAGSGSAGASALAVTVPASSGAAGEPAGCLSVDIPIAELESGACVLGAFEGGPRGGSAPPPAGRPALTAVAIVARGHFLGRPVTKLELHPFTGRRHQLRLHCLALGHPIVGDVTYDVDGARAAAAPRMCLQARSLQVDLGWLLQEGACKGNKRGRDLVRQREAQGLPMLLNGEDEDDFILSGL